MPRDLFGAVASRPPSVGSRRAPFVSSAIHLVAVAGVLVVSLVKTDTLPMPRQTLALSETALQIADVAPPLAPRPRPTIGGPAVPTVNPGAAPLVAPDGVTTETGLEDLLAVEREVGVITGISDPSGILSETRRLEDPPQPIPTEPVRLHAGIRAPLKVTHIAPIYPVIAQQAHVEGVVILEATIDAHGEVTAVTVLRSIPLLDQAALGAVRQWKFTPALLNGIPVPVIMTVTVRFTLS